MVKTHCYPNQEHKQHWWPVPCEHLQTVGEEMSSKHHATVGHLESMNMQIHCVRFLPLPNTDTTADSDRHPWSGACSRIFAAATAVTALVFQNLLSLGMCSIVLCYTLLSMQVGSQRCLACHTRQSLLGDACARTCAFSNSLGRRPTGLPFLNEIRATVRPSDCKSLQRFPSELNRAKRTVSLNRSWLCRH